MTGKLILRDSDSFVSQEKAPVKSSLPVKTSKFTNFVLLKYLHMYVAKVYSTSKMLAASLFDSLEIPFYLLI